MTERVQITRPVVDRRVVIELPEDWEDVREVDITVSPHHAETSEQDASLLYKGLDDIGCIDTDEQLSTTYKQKLDFSDKCGGSR